MEHCLSVAGLLLPPLVKKVLKMKREKNNVWPYAHLEGIHRYHNSSFHKLLEPTTARKKNSLKNLYNYRKFDQQQGLKYLSSDKKIRGKVWFCMLYIILIYCVIVPK